MDQITQGSSMLATLGYEAVALSATGVPEDSQGSTESRPTDYNDVGTAPEWHYWIYEIWMWRFAGREN